MQEAPQTRLIWLAAKALNRDPLVALGLSDALNADTAMFALEMENPEFAEDTRDQRIAETILARHRTETAWKRALPGGTGYKHPPLFARRPAPRRTRALRPPLEVIRDGH